jgi:hypothetical protein
MSRQLGEVDFAWKEERIVFPGSVYIRPYVPTIIGNGNDRFVGSPSEQGLGRENSSGSKHGCELDKTAACQSIDLHGYSTSTRTHAPA